MDLLIPVRKTDDGNEELRYALRSFEKHAHIDRLVTVGHDPKWLKKAVHLPYDEHECPIRNVLGKIKVALASGLSSRFVFSNDDIYLTAYMPDKVFHRTDAPERDPYYHEAYERSKAILEGWQFANVRDHELHAPCIYDTQMLRELLQVLPHKPLGLRTIYFNVSASYSTPMPDPNGTTKPQWCAGALSLGELRDLYPVPSRWER